jgi:hypothetical protein
VSQMRIQMLYELQIAAGFSATRSYFTRRRWRCCRCWRSTTPWAP